MLEKLSDKRTSAKDLSTLLSYLNISSTELKQYAKHRGSTLRSFIKDNEALLIKDEDVLNLTKAVIAESNIKGPDPHSPHSVKVLMKWGFEIISVNGIFYDHLDV